MFTKFLSPTVALIFILFASLYARLCCNARDTEMRGRSRGFLIDTCHPKKNKEYFSGSYVGPYVCYGSIQYQERP